MAHPEFHEQSSAPFDYFGQSVHTIDASYLYFFVVRKQQPIANNVHVRDDNVGVSTAVSVMPVVQSERSGTPEDWEAL